MDFKRNLWGFSYSRPHLEEDYTRILWELPSRFFNVFLKYNGIVLGFDLEFRRGSWGLLKITKWKIAEKFQGDSKVIMRIKKDLTSSVNLDDARSKILIFSWDFRGYQTLPFSRG